MVFSANAVLTAAELNAFSTTTIVTTGTVGIGTASPITTLEIESDDDLTAFEGTGRGSFTITNSDYASGDYQAIDFCYAPDVVPSARIAAQMTGSGSLLMFGTTNSYASGVTNTALTITPGGQLEAEDGTAALPSYSFASGDSNEGMFYLANVTALSGGGVTALQAASNRSYVQADGTASGTAARLFTQTVNGVSMKGLYFDTSFADLKSGIQEWGLSDAQFMAIDTPSYIVNGDHVTADGVHSAPSIEGNGDGEWTTLPDPEGAQLLRRAGFIYENLIEVDLHLVTDNAPDEKAISAAIISKVQELMVRVTALEAA